MNNVTILETVHKVTQSQKIFKLDNVKPKQNVHFKQVYHNELYRKIPETLLLKTDLYFIYFLKGKIYFQKYL